MLLLDMLRSKTVATRARTRLTARDSFLDVESIHDRTHIGKLGRESVFVHFVANAFSAHDCYREAPPDRCRSRPFYSTLHP